MNEAFKKFDLTGKTALVTGGAAGIGYYIARGLARSGAKVVIASRREKVLQEAAARMAAECSGNTVLYHEVDLADRKSVAALAEHAIQTLGGIDIFVGNASRFSNEPVSAIKDETLDEMLQVNVGANVALCRAFLPRMLRNRWGRVVLCSSVSSIRGSGQQSTSSIYGAVKGALNSFAANAATELGQHGITINTILLGPTLTEAWEEAFKQLDKEGGPGTGKALQNSLASMTAIGRLARCDEVEGVVQLLASDAGSYITGSNLAVDGGLSVMMCPNPPAA